jgi:hypothetical protein
VLYKWSEQIKIHPWVGDNYYGSPRKVLLMGDSHYGEGEPPVEFTQDIIRHWCFGDEPAGRFFTGIIWALFGNKNDLGEKYDKIAFYNYVQKFMPAPRVSPSKADYEAAQKPFIEVLEKLSPDFVVSFGKEMTFHFPCIFEEGDNWSKDIAGENHEVWKITFNVGNRSIPVYSLPHPSGGKFNRQIYFQYFLKHGFAF